MKYVYKNNKTGLYFSMESLSDIDDIQNALIIYDDEIWSYLAYHYSKIPYEKEIQEIRKLKLQKINNEAYL